MIKIEKYVVGSGENELYKMLKNNIPQEDVYMNCRLDGKFLDVCEDIYFVAHENGVILSRLWMCYPKHSNAVSNWGAFHTLEEHRGKGIGSKVLDFCFSEIAKLDNPPIGLFCTAGKPWLAKMYGKYGFVPALKNTSYGALYCPIKKSPETFQDLCKSYYTPAKELRAVKATFEWRNEIDCLLNFAMQDLGQSYAINGECNLYNILISTPQRDAKVILTEDNKCVGWMLDGQIKVYPLYEDLLKALTIQLSC